jgi:hypothetical protein
MKYNIIAITFKKGNMIAIGLSYTKIALVFMIAIVSLIFAHRQHRQSTDTKDSIANIIKPAR